MPEFVCSVSIFVWGQLRDEFLTKIYALEDRFTTNISVPDSLITIGSIQSLHLI